jgi:glycosyltransferase involved in cell wall biosynthesis
LKIAVIHDWLVTNAGAEKVLKAILDIYPNADVFSLVDFLSDVDREVVLKGKYAKTSFIQKLPFAKKHFRNYLPLFPKAIESFDLSSYDLIISSSWAVAKGIKKTNNQLHICYCHTPIRYAWDLYDEYISNLSLPKKFLVEQTLKYIRKWDLLTVNRVDYFVANSQFVQKRIQKTYNKDSKVMYPPVDIEKFSLYKQKEDFYLTASRLVPYKRTKLIVEAFNIMPNKKLVVIGEGEEFEEIKKIARKNITVLGYCEDNILVEQMRRAKAFVYAAIEDFGIVPIEAQACGTPVIALNDGGTAETITDGLNGVHFEEQTVESIVNAIDRFEIIKFDAFKIAQSAKSYSVSRFKQEIGSFVLDKIKEREKQI